MSFFYSPILLSLLTLLTLSPQRPSLAQETHHTFSYEIYVRVVTLPGGTFMMGDTGATAGEPAEQPAHEVTVAPFALGTFEVTQAQFAAVMGYNPSYNRDPNKPVERVSWYDAVRFCNALSRLDGLAPAYRTDPVDGYILLPESKGYRLPTEAEWEYAARAGTTTDTYAGDLTTAEGPDATLDPIAWYFISLATRYTREVGSKAPNAFELYDMIGNVWEWTEDWYARYDNKDPEYLKALRGGAMDAAAYANRASYRYRLHPGYTSHNIGFRIARTLD